LHRVESVVEIFSQVYIENVTLKMEKKTVLFECDAFLVVFERTKEGHL